MSAPGDWIVGVDEAGRGPLAGPVVVAAVVFDPARPRINGLNDSKQLNAERRETLYARIVERALAWSIVSVDVDEIDRINIFHATMQGMRRALENAIAGLERERCVARIDGNHLPKALPCRAEAWIDGDARDRAIMAASILAKVARDRAMVALHADHPAYGFDRHKGYSTPEHLAALRAHGPCVIHRRSFAPVRQALEPAAPVCGDLFAPVGLVPA
ncbi:ribonuclease HII [Luteimonas sp. YGD11-2]|uniref:ribonuclease HII n=1 Tax=Luteimonas sp. YGD11-2 TaxID=2508168 RepID=UPI00100ABB10|nr:ribonuclease HII [Luteimonas sp. YGD11-2]